MFLCCSYVSFTGIGKCVTPKNAGNCQSHAALVVDEWMNVKQRWNENDRGKSKYMTENLSQSHIVHQTCHMDRLGIEPRP